ncbi:MAG: hypothetical protein ACLPZR_12240 [Solirubrobacteraceae bacterium]
MRDLTNGHGHADSCRVALACSGFCLLASSIYAVNDVRDAADDRRHPVAVAIASLELARRVGEQTRAPGRQRHRCSANGQVFVRGGPDGGTNGRRGVGPPDSWVLAPLCSFGNCSSARRRRFG